MVSIKGCRAMGQRLLLALALTTIGVVGLARPALAADAAPVDFSAKLVPADAAFYHACLHNREQVEIVCKSRAAAAIKDLIQVHLKKEGIEQLVNMIPGLDKVKQQLESKEVHEGLDFLGDALSHEVFVYGGPNWTECTVMLLHLSNSMRVEMNLAQLQHGENNLSKELVPVAQMLRSLNRHLDQVKVPDTVVGFKVSDTKKAEAYVEKLAALLEGLAEKEARLKGRVQRVKVGDANFLTLTLDGSLVPWDKIPIQDVESKPGEFKPLLKKLKGLKYVISLGVRNGYLLLGQGGSIKPVTRMGGPGQHLSDLPEFKPLAHAAGKRLTSVGYASKTFLAGIVNASQDFRQIFRQVEQAIPPDALTPEQRQQLAKDLKELAKDIKTHQPEIGAALSFAFLTERGYEGYVYDWTKHPHLDGSQTLPLLEHLGGAPLLAAVMRAKPSPEQYQLLVKWVKIALGYVDNVVVPKLNEEQKEEFQKWSKALRPLLKRLDEVTSTKLIPALADGQHAFMLDAKWTSKQWCPQMPASAKPLPLPEIGLLLGVSDSNLFDQACKDYLSILNEALAKVHELAPDKVPEIQVPKPELRTEENNKLASWPLPKALGLDQRILPTAGLSDKVAVLAPSKELAERLLKEMPLKPGPLSGSTLLKGIEKRKLVGVVILNWPGLVNAVLPWVDYGITLRESQKGNDDKDEAKKETKMIRDHVKTISAVLKTFRGSVGVMYLEDGALVRHGELIFRDLPAAK